MPLPEWDLVSKQPYFKYPAASLEKARPASIINKVTNAAELAGAQLKEVAAGAKEVPATLKKVLMSAEGKRPLSVYVGLLHQSELHLAEAFSNSPLITGKVRIFPACAPLWPVGRLNKRKPRDR